MNEAKLLVIGDETVVYGFSLLGIEGRIVAGADEARQALKEAVDGEAASIVLITTQLADCMRERVDLLKSTSLHPLVLELPTAKPQNGNPTDLRTLLQQALGLPLDQVGQ